MRFSSPSLSHLRATKSTDPEDSVGVVIAGTVVAVLLEPGDLCSLVKFSWLALEPQEAQ